MQIAYLTPLVSMLLMISVSISCTAFSPSSGVYKLRSIYRKSLQSTYGDCFNLKIDLDQSGIPSNLYFSGHCCFNSKFTDLKVVVSSTIRGLEGTFQWLHDSSYYLTAKRVGTPLQLKKITGSITDDQRFVFKSTSVCQTCISIMSVTTNRFITISKQGDIYMTDQVIQTGSWFDLYKCDSTLMIFCDFIDVSC